MTSEEIFEKAETAVFVNFITKVYPTGIFSYVSDTFDFWRVLTTITSNPLVKSAIMSREGKVVFRPDSGDPVKIIVGDPEAPSGSPAYKGAVEVLWEEFGGAITSKGFKKLDSHVGLIYGDSISLDRAERILEGLKNKGFSSDNICFGVGSFTYQFVTRDTFGSAIKATWGQVNGEARELWKEPKTDNGVKKSARGLLAVVYDEQQKEYFLVDRVGQGAEERGQLKPVFFNGNLVRKETLKEIREKLDKSLEV